MPTAKPGTVGNTAFSAKTPNLQLAFDSTSLGALKECPRKYELVILEGHVARHENVHLAFGQLYHGALETYDHKRFAGSTHDEAVREAVRYCLVNTRVALPNGSWRPRDWGDSQKNRFTLVRTVVWYLEQFKDDPARTVRLANDKPAVELSFRFETDYTSVAGETFLLCGHMDRVAEFEGSIYVLDRKTTKHTLYPEFFDGFSPDNQMSLYDIAIRVVYGQPSKGIIVDAAQVGVTFSRFLRGFVPRSDEQRAEWYADAGYWMGQAEVFAIKNYWPMNDKSCGNYGGCQFRGICGKSPLVRDKWLQANFTRRVWDPLAIRGDI